VDECTWMYQSVQMKTGGRNTEEECMWMYKRVYMCTYRSKKSEHSERGRVDALGSVDMFILEQEVGAQ